MNDTNDEFNPRRAVRELARLAPARTGRKLTFARKCGAYAALFNGVSASLVADEFHLSRASVSHLAGCREDSRSETIIAAGDYSETHPSPSLTQTRDPHRKPRYQDVAREFERLGENAFLDRYFTPQLHAALVGRVIKPHGADQNASEFAGLFHQSAGITNRPDVMEHFLIAWRDDCWQYVLCKENGDPLSSSWSGVEKNGQFKTSDDARAYLINRP